MANWTTLKAAIADVIKTNSNQEITGQVLQNTLNSIVNAVGENATFASIATPATNPGVPDGPVFYIAKTIGAYSNFGNNIELLYPGFAIIYNTIDSWNILTFYEADIYNRIKKSGTIPGVGTEVGKINFFWSEVFFKKGDKGRIHFFATGNVNSVSCYITTNKSNTAGGYSAIKEADRTLSANSPLDIIFTAEQDGYLMFNISAETSVEVTGDIYIDLTSIVELFINNVADLDSKVATNTDDISAIKRKSHANSNAVSRPTPIVSKVTSWGPDTFGRVEHNDNYALAFIPIYEGATSLTVSGAKVYNTLLYTDIPSDDNYAEVVVPSWAGGANNTINISTHPEARYIALNFDIASNSGGYDNLSVLFNTDVKAISTKYKLFQFGGIANKQPDLGGPQTNWASVIHGVAAQEIETLFVIKSSNSTISSSLIFRLYKGNGATINTAFTELIDTITVTPDEFNQLKSGDIIKLPLSEKIDIGIEDYYTLELEIGTQAIHSLRFGACDAYAAHNLIREGFYKNTTDGNWIIVNTYPEGKYTYGLLWGIYIGEGSSVNFEQSWQEKFYMNILSSLQNYAERLSSDVDKLSSDVAELEDVVNIGLYTLTGNNEESAFGPNRAFNFTDLELIKGNKYKFGIEYTNEEEINSISLYTDNVQGTNSYGYVKIGEFNKAKGLPLEIEFIPDVNGYLMFNIGATVNGSVSVTVKQAIQKSDIATDEIEVGTLTGNNDTDNYTNINFSWFKKKLYAGKKYQIRLVQNLISNTCLLYTSPSPRD